MIFVRDDWVTSFVSLCAVTLREVNPRDLFDSIQVYVFSAESRFLSFTSVVRPKIGIEVCAFMLWTSNLLWTCYEPLSALSLCFVFYLSIWYALISQPINFFVVGHCASFRLLPVGPSNWDCHMFDSHIVVDAFSYNWLGVMHASETRGKRLFK